MTFQQALRFFQKKKPQMYITFTAFVLLVLVLPLTVFLAKQSQQTRSNAAGTGFVTRTGSSLYLNGSSFRFAGTNMVWNGLINATTIPTHAQIDSAFSDAHQMNATVIRSFMTLTVGCANCLEPGLNTFNDNAFEPMDYSLKVASSYGMHLMLPLVDNWSSYYDGGELTYTNWRGSNQQSDFYTNTTIISDFKNHISHVLNHVNQYTGIAYKDDPTIMAWETTNEGWTAPDSWTEMIAEYLKSIAPNQLVADGHMAANSDLYPVQLQLPSVDLYSSHFYSSNWSPAGTFADYTSRIGTSANLAKQYNKVYVLGEYDWTSTSGTQADLASYLASIESTSGVSGDMYWSLFPNGVAGDQYTLYWPGTTTDMQQRAQLLASHAAKMNTVAPTPSPTIAGITTLDDSIQGTGQNQWNYAGTGWSHCTNCNETNPVVTYYNASQSWDAITNDAISVAFIGTQIQLHGVTGPAHGIGAVSIDGGAETMVDFYSTTKTGDVLLWTSPVLTSSSHTLKVRVTGSKNTSSTGTVIPVDRVDITSSTITPTSTPVPTPTFTPIPTNTPFPTNTPTPVTVNLIQNSSFENTGSNWLSPWTFLVRSGANASINQTSTTKVSGSYAALANVTKSNSTAWYVQLSQGSIPLSAARTYTISFWAKASKSRAINIAIQQNYAPYSEYVNKTINITTSWQQYTLTFTQPTTDSNTLFSFNLAQATGSVWLDAVSLK